MNSQRVSFIFAAICIQPMVYRASRIFQRIIRSIYQTEIREGWEGGESEWEMPARCKKLADRSVERLNIGRVYRGISNFIAGHFYARHSKAAAFLPFRFACNDRKWILFPFSRLPVASSLFSLCFFVLSFSLSFSHASRVSRAHSRSPLPASRLGRFYFIFILFSWKRRMSRKDDDVTAFPEEGEFLRASFSLVFFLSPLSRSSKKIVATRRSILARDRNSWHVRDRMSRSSRRLTFYLSPLAKPIRTRTRAVVTISRKYIVYQVVYEEIYLFLKTGNF